MAETREAIAAIAEIAPGSPAAELWSQRPEIARYAQGSYAALLEPTDPGGVSQVERELIALRVAALTGATELAAWHRGRLQRLGVASDLIAAAERPSDEAGLSVRQAALLRHAERVSRAPAQASQAQLAELSAAGLSPREIVTVAQLIGFLSFQLRALAGLRLLAGDV